MTIKLYNTLTRTKEDFTPLDAKKVRMYVCGPTVYDYAHIGNARPVIVFDVLYRLLRHVYGEAHVTYVRNITDVDDKINERAKRDFPNLPFNEAIARVTQSTAAQFRKDVDALGCLPPNIEPRATEHIPEMRQIIERLVQTGFAYVADDHVLFSPQAMDEAGGNLPRYGALANRSLDEMIAGARVDVAPYKKAPTDFVLWKPSKQGEPSWPSPCDIATQGRPGWHIECSAMSWKHLGERFDIHGGGIDLVFPHHENEIAQSTCAFGHNVMANVWMHNGFLQVEGQKMSKSLGNFITIDKVLSQVPGHVARLLMLETHYRQPIDFTGAGLDRARKELLEWTSLLESKEVKIENDFEFDHIFMDAMADDLNTPLALTQLRELFNEAKKSGDVQKFANHAAFLGFNNMPASPYFYKDFTVNLRESGPQIDERVREKIIAVRAYSANASPQISQLIISELKLEGFNVKLEDGYLHVSNQTGADFEKSITESLREVVEPLINARIAARTVKNWAESDRLRDELLAIGIVLKDGKDAQGHPITTWEVKR